MICLFSWRKLGYNRIKFSSGKVSLRYVLFFLLCLFLSFCRDAETPPVETSDDERIEIGIRREPDSLNPYLTRTRTGLMFASRLYPQLFRGDPRFENNMPVLTPVLLASHSWEGPLDLSLTLHSDLKWSDGHPLTTRDLAYSFSVQKDPAVGWMKSDNELLPESWVIKDERTILVHFNTQSLFCLQSLNEGFIIPEHHFSKTPTDKWLEVDWSKDMVVYGPYQVETYEPGQRLILGPLPGKKAPQLGFAFVRDKESLYKALLAKEFDLAWPMPHERIADVQKKLTSFSFENLSIGYIGWNPIDPGVVADVPPSGLAELERLKKEHPHFVFSDARVRNAMTLAMNRVSYNKRIWAGESRVPATPWRAGLPYYSGEKQARGYDPAGAEKLLDEAGWLLKDGVRVKDGRPFKFTILCLSGNSQREQYVLAIREDLRKLGITMEIELQELGLHINALELRHFDAAFSVFGLGTYPDLSALYHSSAPYNHHSWTSADALLEQTGNADTVEELRASISKLEELYDQVQPITLLYVGKLLVGSSDPTLQGRGYYDDPLLEVENWRGK